MPNIRARHNITEFVQWPKCGALLGHLGKTY
jgi:hypothetical protein